MSTSFSTLGQSALKLSDENSDLASQTSVRIESPPLYPNDVQTTWGAFSQRGQNDQWISHVKVQGMYCGACSRRVEQVLLEVPGVLSAHVDAVSSQARIVWCESLVKPMHWLSAVSRAGYALLPMHGIDAIAKARLERRVMLWRWLVAGFCMMQVMMYAWPYYGAVPGEIDPTSDQLLRWASLILALPVLVFSSGPFFRSAWRDLVHARVSMDLPVALGIGLTFAVSTVAVLSPSGAWGAELYFDSLTMLVFFLLSGRWLELRLKQKVASQIQLGAGLLPLSAEVVGDGDTTSTVPSQSLKVGDVIHVRAGETFAGDGVVVRGQSEAEESVLTGEAMPVSKSVGDEVFAASTNLSSPLHVRLKEVGPETRLGQMNQLMQSSIHTKPHIVQLADRVAKPFLLVVLILATMATLYWWQSDPQRGVLAAIAVLVVTCPCALALAAPTAFLSTAAALAKQGLLVRDLAALERLDQIDHFIFDKTGTLTQSAMTVSSVEPQAGYSLDQVLDFAALLANQSIHSVASAISRYVLETRVTTPSKQQSLLQIQEFAGLGVQGTIEGPSRKAMTYRLGSARFCGVDFDSTRVKRRAVYLSESNKLIGIFYLDERLRPDTRLALTRLKLALKEKNPDRTSYITIMSGDSLSSVSAIADQLGWNHKSDQLKADCTAVDKLKGLEQLRAQGLNVAMVGDGINDSPVLAAADVSFAPAQGAALASVNADFLFTCQSLAPIAIAKIQARRTMQIVRQNLTWALIYNMFCIPLALTGVLTPWLAGLGMALSSIAVLANSLRLQRLEK
jgi:P-type Cu2+ transporter